MNEWADHVRSQARLIIDQIADLRRRMSDALTHGFEPKHFILRPDECALLEAEGLISEDDGTIGFPAVPRRVGIEVSTSAPSQLVSLARWIEVTTRLPNSRPARD